MLPQLFLRPFGEVEFGDGGLEVARADGFRSSSTKLKSINTAATGSEAVRLGTAGLGGRKPGSEDLRT